MGSFVAWLSDETQQAIGAEQLLLNRDLEWTGVLTRSLTIYAG